MVSHRTGNNVTSKHLINSSTLNYISLRCSLMRRYDFRWALPRKWNCWICVVQRTAVSTSWTCSVLSVTSTTSGVRTTNRRPSGRDSKHSTCIHLRTDRRRSLMSSLIGPLHWPAAPSGSELKVHTTHYISTKQHTVGYILLPYCGIRTSRLRTMKTGWNGIKEDVWGGRVKGKQTKGRFPLPEFTARVHGPSWRPVNSGAFLTPVNSGLQLG